MQQDSSTLETSGLSKGDRRRQAILAVAHEVFLKEGFAAASMSAIAARAGGSKATLYTYFPSKEALFAAFMVDACQNQVARLFEQMPDIRKDLRAGLVELAVGYIGFVSRDPVLSVHRLVTAEGARFPELAKVFYETGPGRGLLRLADFFAPAMEQGLLRRADPHRAARRFLDLCLSDLYRRQTWGVPPAPTQQAIREEAERGVDDFLSLYGPLP